MKKYICITVFLLFIASSKSQVGDRSTPYSMRNEHRVNLSEIPHFVVARLDNKQLEEEDARFHRENNDHHFTFGTPTTVDSGAIKYVPLP